MTLTKRDLPRLLMGTLYFILGINHFVNPDFYLGVMPDYIPAHALLVALSGIAEILLGAGVCFQPTRRLSAWLIIAMLLAFMPVHIDMIVRHADKFPDLPLLAVWLRIPLQALLIYWAWRYTRPTTT